MTPEKLRKIEEIYHAVLGIPKPEQEGFLELACGNDEELRREVESLLSFDKSFASIIDSPPENLIRKVITAREKSEMINVKVNHFKIISLLGEGGMGTVYLAEDTKLERKVAVKFLSEDFRREGRNLHRFFLEAKSASALNHPNIITVYEIGEFEERPYIASEFIDGVTLKGFLANENISLQQLLEITIQIGSALSTAHKAGIIHRDIKPDNVMIRQDGIVKVLDFGLAKVNQATKDIDSEANTREKHSTLHGVIMGTPNYMSPEQTRGKKIDNRTDIWSFGVLFYQMLTRKLPFQGETTSDIIASILKSEPPPFSDYGVNLPAELEAMTLKALRKNRNERYQSIDEFLAEVKVFYGNLEFASKTGSLNFQLGQHSQERKVTDAEFARLTAGNSAIHSGKISLIVSQTIGRARQSPVLFASLLLSFVTLLAIVGIGFAKLSSPAVQIESFQKMKLAKLTYDGTVTNVAAVSPDGKYIAYAVRNDGIESLLVKQIAANSAVQLTSPAEVTYLGVVFSSDSNYVYYAVAEKNSSNLYEVPVLGGIPRKFVNDVGGKIAFSPDGKTMAFLRSRNSLILADAKSGTEEKILATAAERELWRYVVWNPNGKSMIVVANKNSNEYLLEVDLESGAAKRLDNNDWTIINGISWLSDGSGLVLSGSNAETKFSQLWFNSYPDGKLRHITNDFSLYVKADLTADSNTLIAVKQEKLFNIWFSQDGTQKSLKKLTVEEGKDEGLSGLAQAPDGKVVYTVRKDNAINIWVVNADGSGNQQLTFNQSSNFQPLVSPDGKYIIFVSDRNGSSNIWRMNLDGSEQTAVVENTRNLYSPKFTPDGKWIIYEQRDSTNMTTIWKINVEEKKPVQLTQVDSEKPAVSPDGRFFACTYGTPAKLAIIPIEGGEPAKILDFPLVLKSKKFKWAVDGKSFVYIDKRDRIYNLWSQPVSGEEPRQLTFFDSGQIYTFDVSLDGKGFALSRGNESSDVVMFNDFR